VAPDSIEHMFANELNRPGIPRGLDDMPPGPRLAAVLSSIDVEQLPGRDAIFFARAQHRQIAHDRARQYRALSRVGDLHLEELAEFAPAEIGAALTYNRRRAEWEMGVASDLVHRFPALLLALECGEIDVAKATTILTGVGHLYPMTAAEAVDRILLDAPGLTTGQITARLRKLVIEADPDAARKAYEEGVTSAKVWSCLEPDGTGTMIATGMDAHTLTSANRNINGIARSMKSEGDARSIDKIRAEVFANLLTGESGSTCGPAQVNITGELSTLEGLDDRCGELNGFGPVHADILRQVVEGQHDSTWTYEIRDSRTGSVYVGTTSRRPTMQQKRMIRARYPTCIHPGCRRPATQCDIDHTEDWARGGLTTLCNLAPLCRYHHRLKHTTGWTYRRLGDASIEWTSHFGLRYLTHPP